MPQRDCCFQTMAREVLGRDVATNDMMERLMRTIFPFHPARHAAELLDERLAQFDLQTPGRRTGSRARPSIRLPRTADLVMTATSLHVNKRRIELPQAFFMRVAMGWRSTRLTGNPCH